MSLTATIGGTSVSVLNTLSHQDKIDEQSDCTLSVIDPTGTTVFTKNQQVEIIDTATSTTIFAGFVNNTPTAGLLYPNPARVWALTARDQTWCANKRTINKSYKNQFAGTILVDEVQRVGAAEGLTCKAALRWEELETEWAAGTLTNTLATTNATDGNAGDGDVELALAGSKVTVSGGGSGFRLGNGLLLTGYASSGYSSAYVYRQIWSGSQVIGSSGNDFFEYDVWIASSSPQIKAAVDFTCSDGTTLRSTGATDSQGLSCDPNTDLSGLANDQWDTRFFFPPPSLYGKTITSVAVALGGTSQGTYTAYFRRITYNPNIGAQLVIFGDSSTLTTNTQILNNGYSNVSLTQVAVEDKRVQVIHSGLSIGAAGIVRNSQMSWTEALPNGATGTRETSIDGGASWQALTSGDAVTNLLPGMVVTGRSVLYRDTFVVGIDPTSNIGFGGPTLIVNAAYVATKSDVAASYTAATDFATGTLTSLMTVGSGTTQGVTLSGSQRNWDDAFFGSQTLFGTSGAFAFITNKQLGLQTAAGVDVRSRLDFAGTWQNFTAEIDCVAVSTTVGTGLVYRTTGWQNNNDTYAYSVQLTTNALLLGRGTNSSTGAGAFTSIASVPLSLVANSVHRLKLVINGSNHQLYLDGILLINQTDATFSAAGNVGVRLFNGSGSTQSALFDNFGICAALSGTWQSPSISIASPGTYGGSAIFWDIDGIPDSTTSITAQTSIDSGTTWQSVSNGGAIAGLTTGASLTGKTLLLKLTLAASNAPIVPVLNGVTTWIMGQYSASGTRVSPALSLANVGRATESLVNWNAVLPANTSLAVATSLDSGTTWQSVAAAGDAISGIRTPADPQVDSFTSNTSTDYTASNFGSVGDATGAWVWDTANARLTGTGGVHGSLLLNTALGTADCQIAGIFDACDGSGLIACAVDANNCYYVQAYDGSGTSSQNALLLFKRASGVSTQLGSTITLNWPRGRYRRLVLDVQAGVLTVSVDGLTVLTHTDGSPLGAGHAGVLLGALARCERLRAQEYGQDVTALSVLTRLTLTSTDPAVTPQVLDAQTFVTSEDIDLGALLPEAKHLRTYLSDNLADLNTKSATTWTTIRPDKSVVFRQRDAAPAPWVLDSANKTSNGLKMQGDLLVANLKLSTSGDLYRNRQILTGALGTGLFSQKFAGDDSTRTWNVSNPIVAPPTITLNNQLASVGVKGVDTGRDFYYQLGSTAIDQDSGATLLQKADGWSIDYTGSFVTDAVRDNATAGTFPGTTSQAEMAAIDGTSGIVENVQDVSKLNMSVAAAQAYGDQLLAKYGVLGARTLTFDTLRPGLAPGQDLTTVVPEEGCVNAQLLITQVVATATIAAAVPGGVLWRYSVTATEGANLGSAWRMLSTLLR